MPTEAELEIASKVADGKLGVAEDFGWYLGLTCATAAHLAWDNLFVTIPTVFATFYVSTYRYRGEAAKAQDAYFRAARIGCHADWLKDKLDT